VAERLTMHADAMHVQVFNAASVTHPLAFWPLSSQLSSELKLESEARLRNL